jgi:tetratricopeptide (TPR) repeat protein
MSFLRRLRGPNEANDEFEAARRALGEGRLDEAEAGFLRAVDLGAENPALWFNLGLIYKFRHEWQPAVEANRRCLEMRPKQHEATWNLGVAATALRDWATARSAWSDLGLPVGTNDGPPEADFGMAPIRLNATPDGDGEVVWGKRIDPCRARLESIPLASSGHRWHDVVLHDVVPRGERTIDGQTRAVFDELERMDPSTASTHVAELAWSESDDEASLHDELTVRSLGGEDWSRTLRVICAKCSLANAHAHEGSEESQLGVHEFALAGSTEAIVDALKTWASISAGRRVVLTEPALVY